MPLIYDEGGLLLWRIDESEEELAAMVTATDMEEASGLGSPGTI